MSVTSLPRIRGLLRIDHIEKCVTISARHKIIQYHSSNFPMKRKSSGDPKKSARTILIVTHASIPNLQHIEVVPFSRTSLLSERCGEVDDSGHGAICSARSNKIQVQNCAGMGKGRYENETYGILRVCNQAWMCKGSGRRSRRIPNQIQTNDQHILAYRINGISFM
jgi:hypothetical protein